MTAVSLEAARHSGCGVRWVINAKGGKRSVAAHHMNDRYTQGATIAMFDRRTKAAIRVERSGSHVTPRPDIQAIPNAQCTVTRDILTSALLIATGGDRVYLYLSNGFALVLNDAMV